MKVTQKLNWKSVWLANCLSVCWRIIQIQSRKDSISVADKMNSDISLLGDLIFTAVVLEGSVSAAIVWLSFLPLLLPLQCLSKNINKTPWRECQQDASQGGGTWGEQKQRKEAEKWKENGWGWAIHQSSHIGEIQVLNERLFIYCLVLNQDLLPLSLQMLDV